MQDHVPRRIQISQATPKLFQKDMFIHRTLTYKKQYPIKYAKLYHAQSFSPFYLLVKLYLSGYDLQREQLFQIEST
jgi:hypothetical protein